MKYEIIKPVDCTWDFFGKVLSEIQHDSWLLANRTIQMLWDFQNLSFAYKERFGEYLKMSDLPNLYKSNAGDIGNQLRGTFSRLPSGTFDTTIRKANEKWTQHKKEILKGEKSIINFKRSFPVQVRDRQIKVMKEKDDYYIQFGLLSKKYAEELGRKPSETIFKVLIKAGDKSQKDILHRLLTDVYKVGGSEIFHSKKGKSKWFINLAYTFEPLKELLLDKERILGLDLGIVNAVMMAVNFSSFRSKIEGREIEKFRKRVDARRLSMQKQGKFCGDGRKGHGRSTRIQPIEKLKNKVENFKQTTNHRYSKFIVDTALKMKCGVIQMEDLSNIADGENKGTFLGAWTCYDLQQKIEYKANDAGIEVRYIQPDFTSQRCSDCGYIAKQNRESQQMFKCKKCGFSANADYNAARNISMKNIEQLIEDELKQQRREFVKTNDVEMPFGEGISTKILGRLGRP